MALKKPVLTLQPLQFGPASEQELNAGIDWARTKYEKDVDRDMLRVLFNTANERRTWQYRSALPDIVSLVVHDGVPLSDKEEAHKRAAYKGAIMKIFADRSAWKSKRAAYRRRAREGPAPGSPRKDPPEDPRPKYKGQYKLL